MITRSSTTETTTSIVLPAACFIAFSTRLMTIRRTWSGSVLMIALGSTCTSTTASEPAITEIVSGRKRLRSISSG